MKSVEEEEEGVETKESNESPEDKGTSSAVEESKEVSAAPKVSDLKTTTSQPAQ